MKLGYNGNCETIDEHKYCEIEKNLEACDGSSADKLKECCSIFCSD